jgi:hypothetical protein
MERGRASKNDYGEDHEERLGIQTQAGDFGGGFHRGSLKDYEMKTQI